MFFKQVQRLTCLVQPSRLMPGPIPNQTARANKLAIAEILARLD
jgi:hypothetical protein